MRILDRDVLRVLAAPAQPRHWRALRQMFRTYDEPAQALLRYATNSGSYPWAPRLRTPTGEVAPTLTSYHDLLTVNEVFCRQDYGRATAYDVVMDIGANVGLAALYFLTRNLTCRVYCFEPDPANLARLHTLLAAHAGRVTVVPRAVTAEPSTSVRFQPAGRYGRIAPPDEVAVELPSIGIADALDLVLQDAPGIDLVKIDTEGTEVELLRALLVHPDIGKVRAVVYEDSSGRTRWVPARRHGAP
jgi:FkbM family methyltransferase